MVAEQNQTVWERPLRAGQRNSTVLSLDWSQELEIYCSHQDTNSIETSTVYPLFQPNEKCHRSTILDFLAKNLLSCEQRHPMDSKQFYPVKLL